MTCCRGAHNKTGAGVLDRMNLSICESFTCSPNIALSGEHASAKGMGVVMSSSCVIKGSPSDDEKCLSITYSVHHRRRHRVRVTALISFSGRCVCKPSN